MVQAPKSWYNRYKSYGALGQKTCAKTLPFREIVPAKYVTLFHIIPVPQARRHYMILYLYVPRRNHTILYLHEARHFLAKTIRFCTFTNLLPPVDFVPETTDLADEYHAFLKLKTERYALVGRLTPAHQYSIQWVEWNAVEQAKKHKIFCKVAAR